MMDEEKPKIEVSFIIEMLGKPADHLKETLERLIDTLGNEKGVKIVERKIHEPKKVEQNQNEDKEALEKFKDKTKEDKRIQVLHDIFTTFAEIDAEFDDFGSLLFVAFNYMPSNIQVTKPDNFNIKKDDFDAILTNIILRLHKYDELAKRISIEKALLEGKIKELKEEKK